MAHVRGDLVIDVPPESQVYRQVVRKGLDVRTFVIDPAVRLHYVEVARPEDRALLEQHVALGDVVAKVVPDGLSGRR